MYLRPSELSALFRRRQGIGDRGFEKIPAFFTGLTDDDNFPSKDGSVEFVGQQIVYRNTTSGKRRVKMDQDRVWVRGGGGQRHFRFAEHHVAMTAGIEMTIGK